MDDFENITQKSLNSAQQNSEIINQLNSVLDTEEESEEKRKEKLESEKFQEDKDENFKIKKNSAKPLEKVSAFMNGLVSRFTDPYGGLDISNSQLVKRDKNGEIIPTKRDKQIYAMAKKETIDKPTTIFGADISLDFKNSCVLLEMAGFNLKNLKEANLLNTDDDLEKTIQIRKELIKELEGITGKSSSSSKATKEQCAEAMKKVLTKLEIGERLGLENTPEDIKNLNIAFANGYETAEDIKNLIGGIGPLKMSKLKENIALEAIKNGTKMFDVDRRGNAVEVIPESIVSPGDFSRTQEENLDDILEKAGMGQDDPNLDQDMPNLDAPSTDDINI